MKNRRESEGNKSEGAKSRGDEARSEQRIAAAEEVAIAALGRHAVKTFSF
jgi:hypothetical protein